MPGIFISYRREDSAGWTGRLVGDVKDKFGADRIFSDIDTIEPGADFTDAITRAVGLCDVLLAVIGPRWLTETDTNKQRRLDDPTDWVRTEIAAALRRKIRVIPVLVGKADMPAEKDLPPEIKALAERQAHELSDKRWDYDCQQLVSKLEKTLEIPTKATQRTWSPKTLLIAALAVVITSAGIAFFLRSNILSPSRSSLPNPSSIPSQTATDPAQPPIPDQSPRGSGTKRKPGAASAQYPIHLRANQEARLKTQLDDYTYKILTAELDRATSSTLFLRLVVRFTNNGWPGANFWNDTFRLIIDGVPQVPVSSLNELVEPHSAKEGTVEFTLPDTTTHVVLQLRNKSEVAEIPIDLTETSPNLQRVEPSEQQSKFRNSQFPIRLRAHQEARLKTQFDDYTYKILAAELDRANSTAVRLRLVVRFTVNSSPGANFWNDSFRLLIDGVPRAPVSSLNELVEPHSAKEGAVEFIVPDTTIRVVLQLRNKEDVAEIPMDLTAAQL